MQGFRLAHWRWRARVNSHRRLPHTSLCAVTGAWSTHDTSVFNALDAFHVWGGDFVEVRLKWRQKQPVTLLELR